MHSDLTKSKERIQNIFNYMITQHQNFRIQMKPKTVSGSDISISKDTPYNILVSSNMDTDLSAGITPVRGIARVFRKHYNIEPHTSRLLTQTRFVTSLSCDLETNITIPTSRKIVVSADLDHNI